MLVTYITISLQRDSPTIRTMLAKEAIMKWPIVKNELSMVELASDDKDISS